MNSEIEEKVIEQYQEDEANMILIFVQWCVNHDIDPASLYEKAYPDQPVNPKLTEALEKAISKEEAENIPDDLLLGVLEIFDNDVLAYVVYQEIEGREKRID